MSKALKQLFDEVQEAAARAAKHMELGMDALFKNQGLRMKRIREDFVKADHKSNQAIIKYKQKHGGGDGDGDKSPTDELRDIPLYKQGASKSYLRKHPELEGKEKFLTLVDRGTLGIRGAVLDPLMLQTIGKATAMKIGKSIVPPEVLLQAIYLEFSQTGVETGSGVDGEKVKLDKLMSYEEFKGMVMEDTK